MAYDLEEQEQLDEFKAWWKKNGKLLMSAVIVALVAYLGWQAYQYFQEKKAVEASELYQALVQLEPTKNAEIKAQSAKLMEGYASTAYAGRAAVFAAKSSFSAQDSKTAKTQLQWAIENAQENAVKAIAKLELASILAAEKDYAGAEKLLMAGIDPGYVGLKDDLLGDMYRAQGKQAEAKKAYQSALDHLEPTGRIHQFTQQKLESLGS